MRELSFLGEQGVAAGGEGCSGFAMKLVTLWAAAVDKVFTSGHVTAKLTKARGSTPSALARKTRKLRANGNNAE